MCNTIHIKRLHILKVKLSYLSLLSGHSAYVNCINFNATDRQTDRIFSLLL